LHLKLIVAAVLMLAAIYSLAALSTNSSTTNIIVTDTNSKVSSIFATDQLFGYTLLQGGAS